MLKKEVSFENLTFQISLTQSKELSFAYAVPKKLSTAYVDPLDSYFWKDPSNILNAPIETEWSYDFEGLPTDTSIFKIKSFLIESIAHFIHQNHLVYFWYRPSNPQRERIFNSFIDTFLDVLSKKMGIQWQYQKVEDYFHLNAIEQTT